MDDKRTHSEEEANQLIPEGQISLREYMAGADSMFVSEVVMPETGQRGMEIRTNIKEGMDSLVSVSEVTLEKMLQAGLSFERKRALLQALWEAHPDDPTIDALPAALVTLTVTLYLRNNGLEEVKQGDIEAHRAPYLQFFRAYMDEWKAIGGETRKDQEEVIRELGQILRDKGLIKILIPAAERLEDEAIITSSGAYQVSITDKDYQYALMPLHNKKAYISPLRESIMQKLTFENGRLSVLDSDIAPAQLKEETANGMKDIKSLDLPLLRQIFTAVYKTEIKGDTHTITVHAPSFFREMGIDVRSVPDLEEYRQGNHASSSQSKLNDVFGKLRQFESCIGVSKGTYYELLRAIVIDPQRNTITFATPYMNHILREIKEKNIEKSRAGKCLYDNPGYNFLMHSTITSERNKPAVEIVNRIMAGLLQRGGTADAALPQNKKKVMKNKTRVTYKITYNGLIKDIPDLYQTLKASTTADKNKQLGRAFTKAFELLRTKTDIFNYYVNLKISPEWAPTSSALSDTLTITHEGINGDYQPRE
jgi:hypothetical protein